MLNPALRRRPRRRPGVAAALLAALLALTGLGSGAGGAAAAGMVLRDQAVPGPDGAPAITYSIYLPDRRPAVGHGYPVVFLLHGFGASGREWLDAGDLAATLDRLIAAGEMTPVIAVMPDAARSWYVDSAARGGPGDYETAIVRHLVREVDARFPTRSGPEHRAIAGISMGGYGALRLGFRHPDLFRAVIALSPGLFKPDGLSWRHGPGGARRAALDHWYADTFGRPFDMALYTALSPFAYVDRVAAAEAPPDVMLIVGDDDGFGSYDGTVEMFLDLRAAGLKPELRVGDGGHDWGFWRAMLPEAMRFLDHCWAPGAAPPASAGQGAPTVVAERP